MTDDPKRATASTDKKVRRQDVEPPGHPGEPRHVTFADHQVVGHEPVPCFERRTPQGRAGAN
jgi:hypothetical protein